MAVEPWDPSHLGGGPSARDPGSRMSMCSHRICGYGLLRVPNFSKCICACQKDGGRPKKWDRESPLGVDPLRGFPRPSLPSSRSPWIPRSPPRWPKRHPEGPKEGSKGGCSIFTQLLGLEYCVSYTNGVRGMCSEAPETYSGGCYRVDPDPVGTCLQCPACRADLDSDSTTECSDPKMPEDGAADPGRATRGCSKLPRGPDDAPRDIHNGPKSPRQPQRAQDSPKGVLVLFLQTSLQLSGNSLGTLFCDRLQDS